jgi:hypothetical protein
MGRRADETARRKKEEEWDFNEDQQPALLMLQNKTLITCLIFTLIGTTDWLKTPICTRENPLGA